MLFHSHIFLLVFLPLILAAYYALAGRRWARSWLLIAASFVFYGYWDARLLPLLAGSIGANWLLARLLPGGQGPGAARLLVPAGVALNLAVLGLFKYADFFAGTIAAVTGVDHQGFDIVLPLGISFFTFQQISYLVDLRRGRAPVYAFTDYALYVSFFPQLIAGPIVRHNEIIFQYAADPRRAGMEERLARGAVLLLIGMAKKTLIADGLAAIADPLFSAVEGGALTAAEAWLATLAFAGQIYFDFSGYSDMAIGLGLMFGITLPVNFDRPYGAVSIRDFWRRWHMTLSRFLRDYLYIPLGGSRRGRTRQLGAIVATMLLGGLWHGAGWTFVAWGALHGAALMVNHTWRWYGGRLPRWAAWPLTMLFVTVAWVPFRAESFAGAWTMLSAMAGVAALPVPVLAALDDLWLVPVSLAVAVLGPTSQRFAVELLRPRRSLAVAAGLAVVILALKAGGFGQAEFIYFQF